jgi:hypothetical protein
MVYLRQMWIRGALIVLLTERFEKEMYLGCPMLFDCEQLKPNINGIPDGILRNG